MKLLRLHDGNKGFDFGQSLRALSIDELDFWIGRIKRACPYEASIIQREIDRRDPNGSRGTLWENGTVVLAEVHA